MALEINASKIVNTVAFDVNRKSMQQAKKAIKDVADYGNKQKNFGMKFDRTVQNAKKAEKQIAAAQSQRMNRKVSGTNQQAAAEKQAAREAAQAAKRAETAEIKRRNTALQLGGIMGKTAEEESRVLAETKRITREYEHGAISLQRMNFLLREQTTLTRRAGRARAAHGGGGAEGGFFGAAGKDFVKKGSLSEGLIGGLAGAGMIGAVGAGALGLAIDRGIETVRGATERNNALIQGGKQVNANPNSIAAMALWGQRNGVDSANNEKVQDSLKDVRERVAESVMNSTQDPKTGKWKGGNQAVNAIQNQFGWSTDLIKQYQNNPLDFIGAVANEGQRRGMNEAQIGHMLEDLADDLSYYTKMFANSGAEYKQTIDDMVRAGAAITPELEAATAEAAKFNQALNLAGIGLSNNFTEGFMQALGGVDGFKDAMATLNPLAKELGSEIGDLVHQFTNLVNSAKNVSDWWNNHFGDGAKPKPADVTDATQAAYNSTPYINPTTGIAGADPAAQANANASGDSFWNWVKGFGDRFNEANNMFSGNPTVPTSSVIGGWNSSSLYSGVAQNQSSTMNLSPQIVLPSDLFTVNVKPSTTFGDIIEATMDQKVAFNHQSLILDMNSSTSATGSN
ncbi:hypothetical protein SRABI13_00453 [Erwinia aphidicola]|uniref:hypothetical protein n=1 Tax=Erwinia aphidicola TaxID=68334 RepID=UPI001DBE8D1A|nr:hypothetical protein [Erwinia aphidicola]CAH0148000.1 hypothetical protein SRABI13_00453 [Erwinia aphidicola]